MSDEKETARKYRKTSRNLTKAGKRLGRPRNCHTTHQHNHPLGEKGARPLATLDIVRAVLSGSRPKYAADLASRTEAKPHDAKAVARVAKRLERDRKRIAELRGLDTI